MWQRTDQSKCVWRAKIHRHILTQPRSSRLGVASAAVVWHFLTAYQGIETYDKLQTYTNTWEDRQSVPQRHIPSLAKVCP